MCGGHTSEPYFCTQKSGDGKCFVDDYCNTQNVSVFSQH